MRPVLQYLPNCLSLTRIPIAAAFLILFDPISERRFWWSVTLLCLAVLSDILDGRLARKYGFSSRTGYFIDGIGDKVIYTAVLLVIFREDREQLLLPWLLIAREIILYALRAIEGGSEEALRSLRPLSLLCALFLRLYFIGFVAQVAWHLYNVPYPAIIGWYILFGYVAAICGYTYLFCLARRMARLA